MKEILRITIGLTISCLIAALVMGFVFTITDAAKRHNEHQNVQETMLGLLGYDAAHPKPSDLNLYTIYRYIIGEGDKQYLGYLVPVVEQGKTQHELLIIDLEGNFVDRIPIPLTQDEAVETSNRDKALGEALSHSRTFTYADSTVIATRGHKRRAYILTDEFPGFKTFVKVMLALKPNFEILGLEIMEHEEDPGLGGEIEEPYFKNQFRGKTFEDIKALKVVKKPLPEEYRKVLEYTKGKGQSLSKDEVREIQAKYRNKEIYAITGATISSRAVTNGVKNIVKKFAYRLKILDSVIQGQDIPVTF
ncbi:MAG: FMN-binding protein [Deltaproteobacteria bacterium]|nr:FMN-binding protein [Deltaproteobacteria bacterium]MBW2128619.1 FMN-binding protein [Deltaproteobacteria bacterium]MBW2304752.1 FMN-binding protein [Deltaproteobacteria bacterium]